MWKTILLLIITIVIVPVIAYRVDEPLSAIQKSTLISLVIIYLSFALASFILSSLTKNYSQVDKLWSVLPIVYCWVVSSAGNFEPRLVIMSILSKWNRKQLIAGGRFFDIRASPKAYAYRSTNCWMSKVQIYPARR